MVFIKQRLGNLFRFPFRSALPIQPGAHRIHDAGQIVQQIVCAAFIGLMQAGASRMQFESGVAPEIIDIIQALILLFVSADAIIRKLFRPGTADDRGIKLSSGWGGQS
jgi:hypothetical protein